MFHSLTLQLLHYYRVIWWAVFLVAALPAATLLYDYYSDQLGANPLQTLQHATGRWGLIFLLITLSVTPLRHTLNSFCIYIHFQYGKRLEDWNWIMRLRRMLGLYSFFYASLHVLVYVGLDLSLNWSWAQQDIREKPYILLGVVSYLMLIPLAITSSSKLFKLIGRKNWRRLHKLIYLIVILACIHYWWQSKVGVTAYLPYLGVTIFLLGFRLFSWLDIIHRRPRDDGMEVEARK